MLVNNSEDVFSASKYPEMAKELNVLKEDAAHTPIYFKTEIIISYLKNHSIQNKWIEANPRLVAFLLSNSSKTSHIESLFEFYRFRQLSLKNYETYIRHVFLAS